MKGIMCVVAFAMLIGCGRQVGKPTSPAAAPDTAAVTGTRSSPFKCSADDFESEMAKIGLPFRKSTKSDAALLFRDTKPRQGDEGSGVVSEYLWLSRQDGQVRSVVHWCGMSAVAANAGQDRNVSAMSRFASIARPILGNETSKAAGWLMVSRMAAEEFAKHRSTLMSLTKEPIEVAETDFVCIVGGLRISYRRLEHPNGLIMHVTNFDINHKSPDWPDGPFVSE